MQKTNCMYFRFFRLKVIEFIKFGPKFYWLPVTIGIAAICWILLLSGKDKTLMAILPSFHRIDWPLSEYFSILFFKKINKKQNNNGENNLSLIYHNHIDSQKPNKTSSKFIKDPASFFPGMCIVIKSSTDNEKGIILIKYSYAFPLLIRIFDISKISERYYIVIEPSWNGYLNLDILCCNLVSAPVFVQTLEPRDTRFLKKIDTNLIPIPTGTNWWIDYKQFHPLGIEKDIDIVMVASWADFKRHYRFFKVLREIKRRGICLRVSLVGYPTQRKLEDIKEEAKYFGIEDQLEFHEWLKPEEVNFQMNRAKINLIWSRFEGNNRVVIEGFFAGVPCILREGFNYGYHYPFINDKTGIYANDDNLAQKISWMFDNLSCFEPRAWAISNMSCESATKILGKSIKDTMAIRELEWQGRIAIKVNELHGMRYFNQTDADDFEQDYKFLNKSVREK